MCIISCDWSKPIGAGRLEYRIRRDAIVTGRRRQHYARRTREQGRLLSSVLLHGQDLDHTHKDVDEVELKADGLVDRITLDQTALGETGVVQDLLDVVKGEATENDETTVEPEVLGEHESAGGGGRKNQRSEAGKSDNSDTSEKRATNVEVLVSLCSGTDKSNATHQTDSVETGASEDGGVVEHEGRQEGGLGQVEGGPEGVLGDVAAGLD
jgi:hypothetical protein